MSAEPQNGYDSGKGRAYMNNKMEYKGYIGSVEFSEENARLFGKVMGVHAQISYEGETARQLVDDFHAAVDGYLALCASKGVEPERAFKGSFNVRISPELHRRAAIAALSRQMSLNSFVEDSIQQAICAGGYSA